MIVDINNLDEMIRGYITNTVKEYYPDIDTSENSPFDDLFIKSTIELIRPFMDSLSRLELKSNLANAERLTESELDEIGEGNYFTSRKRGSSASTNITLTFANLNLEDPDFIIKVPTGAIFATGAGLEYQTQHTTVLNAEDMKAGYNKAKLVYEIDIPVVASDIGSSFNVGAGEIVFCRTFISNSLISSVNKTDVIDGKDKESNADYAERIKDFYLSRQLGTAPGYKNFIMDLFDEIKDVYVSGYKDKYMERDKLKVVDELTGEIVERHIGGAVDIYLKGCIFDSDEKVVKLNNNIIMLSCNYDELVDPTKIELFNLTDASKRPVIESVSKVGEGQYGGGYVDKAVAIISNVDEVSYTENAVSQMKMVYSYVSDDGPATEEDYFDIGLTEVELASPVKSVDSLVDWQNEAIPNMESKVDIIKTGIPETTDEYCKVRLKGLSDYPNGDDIKIRYTSNRTLRHLRDLLTGEKHRIITADVIGKEAKSVPVNVAFRLKATPAYRNFDRRTIETRVKASISAFFNNYKLGDSVEESDLVGWMYTDASISEMIQYIALPFDVFYIPNLPTDDIPSDGSQISPDGVLPIEAIEYPYLNASKFEVTVI